MQTANKKASSHVKIEYVALGAMFFSEIVQRELKQSRVDALVTNFDIDQMGVPVVNIRADGRISVVDGQHRISGLKAFLGQGWESQKILCQVFRGLSESEEAEMFLTLNDTLTVTTFDKFQKAIVAGREEETDVAKILKAQGLNYSRVRNPNSVACVGTLMRIYRRGGAKILARVLRLALNAYETAGMEAQVLDGLGHLFERYEKVIDEQQAAEKLQHARGGVKGLLQRAQEYKLRTGNLLPICVAAAVVDIYNGGKGGNKRNQLPNWWAIQKPQDAKS